MKTGMALLILLSSTQLSYGIGRPHNLFAARKAMLALQAEQHRPKSSPAQHALKGIKRYSYTLLPQFGQFARLRE